MPNIETVQTRVSGVLDLEPVPIHDFPAFVEGLVAKGVGFPIYQRESIDPTKHFLQTPKPIITYSGDGSLVRIVDPENKIKGAFVVINKTLVYDPHGMQTHEDRDSYRWRCPPYRYYIDQGFGEVIRAYEEAGYTIFLSRDRWLFDRNRPIFGEQTTVVQISEMNNL